LCSRGFSYSTDKSNVKSVNWRCDTSNCPGRCTSGLTGPPVEITTPHNHLPNLFLKEILTQRETLKDEAKTASLNKPRRMIRSANSNLSEVLAQLPTTDASRQAINRIRSCNVDGGKNPTTREEISIARELQTTLSGMKFLFEDSSDGDRILVFTTHENLKILKKNS